SQPLDQLTRLTIDLTGSDGAAPSAAAAPPPPNVDLAPSPGTPALHTIALDPGHGGADEGVKGPSGVKEKDLTLAVARRVKAAVEARLGIRVVLTRDDDRDLQPDDRTSVANNNKAELVISLHANASLRAAAAGASIYCAAFDPAARSGLAGNAVRLPAFGG